MRVRACVCVCAFHPSVRRQPASKRTGPASSQPVELHVRAPARSTRSPTTQGDLRRWLSHSRAAQQSLRSRRRATNLCEHRH
eukprot:3381360-Alexandrium_andersonii.AAC.1